MEYKVEKTWTSENGHLCVVLAINRGFRCGYVLINENNSLYGKHYNDEAQCLSAHGGITFSDKLTEGYPIDINGNFWVFGFDCIHGGDGIDETILAEKPTYVTMSFYGTVRTLDYCITECEDLSRQLKEFESIKYNDTNFVSQFQTGYQCK